MSQAGQTSGSVPTAETSRAVSVRVAMLHAAQCAGHAEAAARLITPVWPCREDRLTWIPVDAERLCQDPEQAARAARCDLCLALPTDDGSARAVLRACTRLAEAGRPVVCVLPEGLRPWRARFVRVGAVVHAAESGVEALAGLLTGVLRMAERVGSLEQELAVADRLAQSAKQWMRRVDEELHLASRLQRQIASPKLPQTPGLRVGSLFRPLWHVSGDIYRAERLADGRLGVLLADAMGHGLCAAMSSVILAHFLRFVRRDADGAVRAIRPAESMLSLNDEMLRHTSESMRFASAVCALIDPGDGSVEIASAGHPPALVIRADGRVETLTAEGPLLGVFDDAEFVPARTALGPGETLVLHTDGLEQGLCGTGAGSGALLQATLRQCAGPDPRCPGDVCPAIAADRLSELLDAKAGSLHRDDDASAVLITRA